MHNVTKHHGDPFPLGLLTALVLAALAVGCSTTPTISEREHQARFAFNQTMRLYHVPASEASNTVDRAALLDQSAFAYKKLEQDYSDVPRWAAASLRNLGQINVERGQLKEALVCYEQVGRRYPDEHWEVIQSWKAAADALWAAHQRSEAMLFYRQIVNTYGGKAGQPAMFDTIVTVARSRLKEAGGP